MVIKSPNSWPIPKLRAHLSAADRNFEQNRKQFRMQLVGNSREIGQSNFCDLFSVFVQLNSLHLKLFFKIEF